MSSLHLQPFNDVFGCEPTLVCSSHFAQVTRPRLWWFSEPMNWPPNTQIERKEHWWVVTPRAVRQPLTEVLEQGWWPEVVASGKVNVNGFNFKCLVQHRPKAKPMSNPRGLAACDSKTMARWREDQFARAPYLYRPENLLRPT